MAAICTLDSMPGRTDRRWRWCSPLVVCAVLCCAVLTVYLQACASDVDGDGLVNVNDLLSMLSQFGARGELAEDVNDDGTVNVRRAPSAPTPYLALPAPSARILPPYLPPLTRDGRSMFCVEQVNDLLQLLSNFGGDLAGCSRDGMAGAADPNEEVNCCGGGGSCGYLHCPALGAGEDGCVQPWNMPNGMDFDTDCSADTEPAVEAPLWCPESPIQMCRMMCPDAEPCPAGQCNMRQGNCCDKTCVAFEPEECTGCCPAGAACFAPDPPCCAERQAACGQGEDCGGQVWNGCASSCPAICGQDGPMICNMMCNQAFECPNRQCFNEQTGECEAGGGGGGGGGDLPILVPGRPFLASAKYDPTPHKVAPITSSAVGGASDWMMAL